jgi:hypothetical protein
MAESPLAKHPLPGRTAGLQRSSLVRTRVTSTMDRRMEPIGTHGHGISIQQFLGRRIPIPWCAASKDAGRLWKLGLGRERRYVRAVSSPPAVERALEYPVWFAGGIRRQALPYQLVPHHSPFRAGYLFHRTDPGTGPWSCIRAAEHRTWSTRRGWHKTKNDLLKGSRSLFSNLQRLFSQLSMQAHHHVPVGTQNKKRLRMDCHARH